MLAAKHRVVIPSHLIGSLRLHRWNLLPSTVLIYSYEHQVSACDMEVRSGLGILNPDFHTDFEGCIEGAIDAGLQNEQIAYVDGLDEIDMVHRCCDHMRPGVPICRDRSGEIDEVHEAAAEQVAERVCIVGEDDLSHLGLRAGYGTHKRVGFCRAHGGLLRNSCEETSA